MTIITLSDALPAGTYVLTVDAANPSNPNPSTSNPAPAPSSQNLTINVTDIARGWAPTTIPPSTIPVVNDSVTFTIIVPEGYSTKGKTPPFLEAGEAFSDRQLQTTQISLNDVPLPGTERNNHLSFVTADDPRPNHGVLYVGANRVKFTFDGATAVVANYRSWP